jgi:hypothetical protein
VRDDTVIDQERIIVSALASMEVPHVRILAFMVTQRPMVHTLGSFSQAQIGHEYRGYTETLPNIISVLSSHGLIRAKDVELDKALDPVYDKINEIAGKRQGRPQVGRRKFRP